MHPLIYQTDLFVERYINHSLANPAFDFIMPLVSSTFFWVAIFGLYFIKAYVKQRDQVMIMVPLLLFCFIVFCCNDFITFFFLKNWFQRLRPCIELLDVRLPTDNCAGREGFPSNHAANSGALITSFYLANRHVFGKSFLGLRFLAWSLPTALVIGFSRIYLGVHYPLDVICGFISGTAVALALVPGLRFLKKQDRAHQ